MRARGTSKGASHLLPVPRTILFSTSHKFKKWLLFWKWNSGLTPIWIVICCDSILSCNSPSSSFLYVTCTSSFCHMCFHDTIVVPIFLMMQSLNSSNCLESHCSLCLNQNWSTSFILIIKFANVLNQNWYVKAKYH
jgi:hypothetical protein